MPEYSTPNGQHNVDYTHNPYVRQTVQSPPSNNILNTYTTRRDYMAYLRKQNHHGIIGKKYVAIIWVILKQI